MLSKKIKIIHEDKDIVVISKPAGMVTNRADSVKEETVQDWFVDRYLVGIKPSEFASFFVKDWEVQVPADFDDQYGSPEEIFEQRLGMVHRLDKNTSGILILAKHPGSLVNLLKQFRERLVQKEYLALAHGKFRVEKGVINAPLGRSRKDRKKFAVTVDGREAITAYEAEKEFSSLNWDLLEKKMEESEGESKKNLSQKSRPPLKKLKKLYEAGFSLVKCLPKTGRTHQIRVHLAHENHPLVGDVIYLGKKRAKIDPTWCPRHFLHAYSLEVSHPRVEEGDNKSEKIRFEADLSQDLQHVLELLVA